MKHVVVFAALSVVLATLVQSGPAQEAKTTLQPAPGEEAVLGSLVEGKLSSKDSIRLGDMRNGKRPVLDPSKQEAEENRRVLALAAKWYVYRLTHPIFHGQSDKTTIHDLFQDDIFRALLLIPASLRKGGLDPNQEIYLQELAKEMIPCCREVLKKNGKAIVRVNTVRTLAAIAETGPFQNQEEVADTLVEVLNNPQESDAVKLYALRGLRELFGHGSERSIVKDGKREIRCIQALHQFLNRPSTLAKDPPADELDGYRYVRREALRALGQTRYPIMPKAKDGEGRTALLLLRYLRKDGITPEPSLAEQLEAAIGICQLRPALDKDYQADYAAHHVGAFVVDFVNQYSRGGLLPWKLSSARLAIALEQLKASAAGAPAKSAEYINQVADRSKEVLKPVDVDKEVNPLGLDNWLRSTPPPRGSVYGSIKDSVVKPGS